MATVTLTGTPGPNRRSVLDPETGIRFHLGVPVDDVDQDVLERVKALDGYEFEVEGSGHQSGRKRSGTKPPNGGETGPDGPGGS